MITYLAKFILCSILFFIAYLFLLEKEKIHRFKRFYLLASLTLALVIPLISISQSSTALLHETSTYLNNYNSPFDTAAPIGQASFVQQPSNNWPYLLAAGYAGITILLLFRFGRNIYRLWLQIKRSKKTTWHGTKIILDEKITVPYSFMSYIFVNQSDYEQQQIAEEILQHELAHVRQKHSIDVLLVEFLRIFFWFNPVLYFYRKAIQTNHEYLADENVIELFQDISSYQLILLQHISKQNRLTLTSQFTYLTIKKRLIMMNKTLNQKIVLGKQFLLIPTLGLALFLFSTRTDAQVKFNSSKQAAPGSTTQTTSTKDGVSLAEMKQYSAIEDKYTANKSIQLQKVTAEEKQLLESIYTRMSVAQQREVKIIFIRQRRLQQKTPSATQFEAFKNANEYGVWINDKKVANTELANYQANDFKQVTVSRLYGKAKENRTYAQQVDLMTTDYFNDYLAKTKPQQNIMLARYMIAKNSK
ncbi:M56 family metallopeptidase [Pedobacter sp. KR3-3]|uniref:M56 family metallopeptidase n=1 Tax=Pedobacter albus TaxID=3113905 RepID=A0ABU7IBD5_9SPHI|nr:M56 family metallopeptidase [Pedobacter sp. KR3-3]MEE1946803.1 M56 family metallopeptidase [Pedobacter sp. KR3-3]